MKKNAYGVVVFEAKGSAESEIALQALLDAGITTAVKASFPGRGREVSVAAEDVERAVNILSRAT